MFQENPFVIEGYVSPEYFCDRQTETDLLIDHITNGRNVALIAKRRLGKSGLIFNMFYQKEIQDRFNTFYVDIYETKNMSEFVYELGKNILASLKPKGRKAWESFIDILTSLKHTFTFDNRGLPVWSVKIGEITTPDVTLDEIFHYLSTADNPSIIAIDEFQVIANYPEKTVEASLRKRIQNCHNARFIYSGSHSHMMSQMFASPSHPFYNSCALMGLAPIPMNLYFCFANSHFNKNVQSISEEAFKFLYEKFDGITWYIQFILNTLYSSRSSGMTFEIANIEKAIDDILQRNSFVYSSLLFQLTTKQKQLLFALCAEQRAKSIMSQEFLRKYELSSSTVQTALKLLLDKDFVTREEDGAYVVYNRFFDAWLRKRS